MVREIFIQALVADDKESATFHIISAKPESDDTRISTFDLPDHEAQVVVFWQPSKPDNADDWKIAIETVVLLSLEA